MEKETQQQPQKTSQKTLLWKSPSGWRYYSPPARSRWPLTERRVLTIIAIVVALVSLSLIGYFFWWGLGAEQSPRAIAEHTLGLLDSS
jgi:flagellar basal body-associated protein FliL